MATISSIKEFRFTIGGYGSTNFYFGLQGNIASYSADLYDIRFGVKHLREISEAELKEFLAKLNELKILEWESNYESNILDGIQWELDMVYNDTQKKRSYGSNSYPDSKGYSLKPSPTFNQFLNAISELIQVSSFFSDDFFLN